jgi:Tol biopolymer transport system component
LDDATATRLTFDGRAEQYAVWSPRDGRWLAYSSLRKGHYELYRKRTNGVGGEEPLYESPLSKNMDDWTDGYILFNSEDPKTQRDLWFLRVDGEGHALGEPEVFLKTDNQEHRGQFSPDGHWVAYVSNKNNGRSDIWVRPFPPRPDGGEWQISAAGGIQPRWSAAGDEIYYIAEGKMMARKIAYKGAAIEPGRIETLFPVRIPGGSNNFSRPQFDVDRNGRFLIVIPDDSGTSPITLLQNWKQPK